MRLLRGSASSPPKWPSTNLFFYLTDSRRPPAELKVASKLSDQNLWHFI